MNTANDKGVLAVREAHNAVISDAVRLLEDPEIRAAMDRHAGFAFDARSVVSRLMSTYVDAVNADAPVAELVEAAKVFVNDDRQRAWHVSYRPQLDALAAALARVGGAK